MNKDSWYLASEDKWLYGKEAFDYVSSKLTNAQTLMQDISITIDSITELIGNDEENTNIYDEYLDIAEKISLVEVCLEGALENIRRRKYND